MRPENKRMTEFLANHGIHARVKYIPNGSLRGCWRLYDGVQLWTQSLQDQLNELGFVGFNNKRLWLYSGNGGVFSVFVRGHNELLTGGNDQ
jgi:hypothetical protein